MRSPVRARLRPRPVEHFDTGTALQASDGRDAVLLALCTVNLALQRDVAAWRLRYYATATDVPTQPRWEPPEIPAQRDPPDDDRVTNRYQRLRLERADL